MRPPNSLIQMTNIDVGSGPPETVLAPEPAEAMVVLEQAMGGDSDTRRDSVSAVVARWPELQAGWASLGDLARDDIEAYAAYRVGYHRGLERLRQNGWRDSGYIRWEHESNRGFLRSVDGLRRAAEAIGESTEEERHRILLTQLDPTWSTQPSN